MQCLDFRFEKLVQELAKKHEIEYSDDLRKEVTKNVIIGYSKEYTWDNAVMVIEERLINKKLKVA